MILTFSFCFCSPLGARAHGVEIMRFPPPAFVYLPSIHHCPFPRSNILGRDGSSSLESGSPDFRTLYVLNWFDSRYVFLMFFLSLFMPAQQVIAPILVHHAHPMPISDIVRCSVMAARRHHGYVSATEDLMNQPWELEMIAITDIIKPDNKRRSTKLR